MKAGADREWMTPEEVFPGFGAGHNYKKMAKRLGKVLNTDWRLLLS